MENDQYIIETSPKLTGIADLTGAKNAVLVIMASLLLTSGKSKLTNVPYSQDVIHMIALLESLGATIIFDQEAHILFVDTTDVRTWIVCPNIMKKMRASILVMGPLLARFARAKIALPGGCVIGSRPIDLHIKNFKKMGALFSQEDEYVSVMLPTLKSGTYVLEYPSVGATENILMASILAQGITKIINAALEPEVIDLICALSKMGAHITVIAPATIEIRGVTQLRPIEHMIIPDRLEAGALLLASAITGGHISIPQARADMMDVFLLKLEEMGHTVISGINGIGIMIQATNTPQAVSFKTGPYPGFPTDLQAPMMVAQTIAQGTSVIEETVFENRMLHVRELQKMGAQIDVRYNKAIITGVDALYGASVIASDIRASCALMLAGFVANGITCMTGLMHFRRGYDQLDKKLSLLGARITLLETPDIQGQMQQSKEEQKELDN